MATEVETQVPTAGTNGVVGGANEEETPVPSGVAEDATKTAAGSDPAGEEEKKRKSGWQRKIDRLTRQNAERDETIREQQLAIDRLNARLAGKPVETERKTSVADGDPEPKEEDYPDYKSFVKAMSAWNTRQALNEHTKKTEEESAKRTESERQEEAYQGHLSRLEEAKERYPDWDDVTESLTNDDKIPQAAAIYLTRMKDGPDLMYHLAQHPELRQKLWELDSAELGPELGRIAATLKPPQKKTTPASKVPAPIRPVGGGGAKPVTELDKLPLKEYMDKRKAQNRRH